LNLIRVMPAKGASMSAVSVVGEAQPARPPDDSTIGIRPVPPELRRLRALDIGVLWGDLAIGVLVLVAGALLVTSTDAGGLGLAFGPALGAIALGSVAGALLLALVAATGHDRGVPTMVLLRPVLGRYGSYGASALNVAQLVGWTAFELWAMALFANRVSDEVFGFTAFGLWLALAAVVCTALALIGPVRVVRVWLEKVGAWVVVAACGYLTIYLVGHGEDLFRSTSGGAPFGLAVDLVVSLPVSWLPLVADYNRFAVSRRQNFAGTFAGYAAGNAWFYALGALLVLAAGLDDPSPAGIAAGILGLSAATVVGVLLLLALLAGETDEAFADIYSAAVSVQNVFPRLGHRALVAGVGAAGTALAAVVSMGDYENFLLLLGSVFVPLFGVLLGHWVATGAEGRAGAGREPRFRPALVAVWAAGVLTYQWALPREVFFPAWWVRLIDRIPGALDHASFGASLPAFALAFAGAALVTRLRRNHEVVPTP
jgi:putative hydroxymethylpyrimidine transporter CytX